MILETEIDTYKVTTVLDTDIVSIIPEKWSRHGLRRR